MSDKSVKSRPGMGIERDREKKNALIYKQLAQLMKDGLVVGNVLDDVEQTNQVEAFFGEG